MEFRNGLPKDSGASDYADSARAAGMMVLAEDPSFDPRMIVKYFVTVDGRLHPVRNPDEAPANNYKNFTRDQMMALAAGLAKAGYPMFAQIMLQQAEDSSRFIKRAPNVEKDMPGTTKTSPDGPDILSPSHMNHLRICAGQKPKLFGKIWLMVDIMSSLLIEKEELNQLMAMCWMAGPFYVKLLRRFDKGLDDSINSYWKGWRNEPALADLLVAKFR